jgi:hypothetical protein
MDKDLVLANPLPGAVLHGRRDKGAHVLGIAHCPIDY